METPNGTEQPNSRSHGRIMLDRNSMLSFLKEYHWIKGELWVNFDYVNQLSKDFDYFKDGFDERGKIIEELREKIQELESKIL